jgi:hypothetical protein
LSSRVLVNRYGAIEGSISSSVLFPLTEGAQCAVKALSARNAANAETAVLGLTRSLRTRTWWRLHKELTKIDEQAIQVLLTLAANKRPSKL